MWSVAWRWLTVIGLAMTPALIAGRSAAITAGIAFEFPAVALVPVVSVSSFIGGLLTLRLADLSERVAWLERFLKRFHKPRAVAWCQKWGPWGGLTLGVAVLGPIPILLALKWMTVEDRKLLPPLAVSSVLFTFIWYYLIDFGFDQAGEFEQMYNLMFG